MIMNLFSFVIGILMDQDVDVSAARVDDVILDGNHVDIFSFKVRNLKKKKICSRKKARKN